MAKKAKKQDKTESRQKFNNEHVDIDEYKYIEFQYDAHGQGFESEVMLLSLFTIYYETRNFNDHCNSELQNTKKCIKLEGASS